MKSMKKCGLALLLVATLTMVFSLQVSAKSFEPLDCPCVSPEFLELVENRTCDAGYEETAIRDKYYSYFNFISFGWGDADLWGQIERGNGENPKARSCELGIGAAGNPKPSLSSYEYVACKKYFKKLSETLKSLESCD